MYSGADTLTGGFPHSEIRGSTIARISPQLIAACHVLHRLLAPRHPPNALIALIRTTHAHTQDQAPRTFCAAQTKCSATTNQSLHFVHAAPQSPNRSRSSATTIRRDQPFRFTCQTTPPPSSDPSGALRRTAKPVVQRHVRALQGMTTRFSPRPLNPKGKIKHQLTSYGDGRYRTDGPLLAKQVLYH
jgi:hypothetical protein